MAYDVVVVGAGPVGSRVAELTAKRGLKTAVIEKNSEVGTPVQCAGLVSHRIKALVPDLPDNVVLNKVDRARFFCGSSKLELKSKRPFYVIDRQRLDSFLFLRARKAGAHAGLHVLFKEFEKKVEEKKVKDSVETEESLILSTTAGRMQTKIMVGADGPISTVAAKACLQRPANMMGGVQMTVDSKGKFDHDAVELFFGSGITPDFFGWVVPLSDDRARIGVASKRGAVSYLKRLVEKRTGGDVNASDVRPDVAGRINFGLMERTSAERVMVVGDAAAQVKPFSGGGVVYGLIGAGYCANACIKAVREDDFSARFLRREYDDKWKAHLAGPIRRGMLYRSAMIGLDGNISDRRTNLILRLGNVFKSVLECFDVDLL